jgi:hypothetical protein
MNRDEIRQLIADCLGDLLAAHEPAPADSPGGPARLIGPESLLDSLSLVNLILDVEQRLEEQAGVTVTLADDRAMSQRTSPFLTVDTLADYVTMLLEERGSRAGT